MPNHKKEGVRGHAAGASLHPREPERPITAYPRAPRDELGSIAPPESGLSVDTEDLGAQFLSHATEQSSEWPLADADGDGAGDEEWGDDALGTLASGYELDPAGWERSLRRALRLGSLRPVPPRRRRAGGAQGEDDEVSAPDDDLDLTDEAIHEVSLLDHEGSEFGEVESPELRTEDTGRHGKRRGGHAPSRRRRAL